MPLTMLASQQKSIMNYHVLVSRLNTIVSVYKTINENINKHSFLYLSLQTSSIFGIWYRHRIIFRQKTKLQISVFFTLNRSL